MSDRDARLEAAAQPTPAQCCGECRWLDRIGTREPLLGNCIAPLMQPSDRDPRMDPRPGDELRGNPWRYRITRLWSDHAISFDLLDMEGLRVCQHTVSLSGWRDMAAGLSVEKVA